MINFSETRNVNYKGVEMKTQTYLIIFLLIIVNLFTEIRKEPYLIYCGNNSQMTILWQMENTCECELEWGLDSLYTSGNVQTSEYGSSHQHSFTFDNLICEIKYYYRVYADNEYFTGSFMAAPAETETNIRFMIYGDSRTNTQIHNEVAGTMISTYINEPEFQALVFSTGDITTFGAVESYWDDEFFNPDLENVSQLIAEVPYISALGNHELYYENYVNVNLNTPLFGKYFPYPFENRRYWSFDYGIVHFTIVDQYPNNYDPYGYGMLSIEQLIWIENDLNSTDKLLKIIILHEPGWSAGRDSESYPHPNNDDVQNLLQPICEQYGVQVVFSGHNHYYSRACKNGIYHITTAGGGANIYSPDTEYPNVICTFQENHFCKVEICNGILTVSAVNSENEVFDEFSIDSVLKPNYLLGFINLSARNGIIGDVLIEINGATFYPDEIGYYGIELESGFYDVTVSLENYITQNFNNIEILDGTETILNVSLEAISSVENGIVKNLFHLQNYPNPFNPETTIFFETRKNTNRSETETCETHDLKIEIFNIKGQNLREFKIQNFTFKNNSIIWDGTDDNGNQQPTGIYFINLKVNGKNIGSKKCLLLK